MKFISDCEYLKGKLWYVGTPYSKYPLGLEMAFQHSSMLIGDLLRKGVTGYSPIVHTHPVAIYSEIDPYSHEIWMPFDKKMMEVTGGMLVAMMDGWETSKGIGMEIDEFESMGKRIVYMGVEK